MANFGQTDGARYAQGKTRKAFIDFQCAIRRSWGLRYLSSSRRMSLDSPGQRYKYQYVENDVVMTKFVPEENVSA